MKWYVLLLRGINVGGKNSVPMSKLKTCLEGLGFSEVTTYIASGNVIVRSDKSVKEVRDVVEKALTIHFNLDSALVKVLVLTKSDIRAVVTHKPEGFGEEPEKYHSDVIFLMGITSTQAMKVFCPRDGVDMIWKGKGVIYSQRVSELRTKSRLNQMMGTPEYACMTIRNWNTVSNLVRLLEKRR